MILNCVNAFSYQRFGLNGKMYSKKSYSTQFKRQNCVICDVKGNGLEIKNVVQLQVNCKCMLNLGAGCILKTSPAAHSFLILCDNLSLNPIAPSIKRHSRVNLNGFLKVVQRSEDGSTIAISQNEITYKGLIVRCMNNEEIFLVNNIRFELD